MFFNKKKFLSFLMPLIAVVFMAVVAGGCGGGGGDSPSPGPEPRPEGARYTPGEEKILVEKKIGAMGGVIEINAPGTPVDGAKIDLPAGALPADYDVGVGYDTGNVAFKSNPALAGVPILVMNMAYKGEFARPVKITVPMRDREATPVPYYINEDGKLQVMSLTGIDRAKGECSFVTFHASEFTVPELKLEDIPIAKFNMAYEPSKDGFQIANVGSTYNSDGECFGMSAFSMWYSWRRESTDRGRLYSRFMEKVGEDRDGKEILGQDVVATRSHTSVSKLWQIHYSDIAGRQINDCTPEDRFITITAAMIDSACPVVLYLLEDIASGDVTSGDVTSGDASKAGKQHFAHAILAYGYSFSDEERSSANIHFYDPNHPGDDHLFVNYRTDTKDFGGYEDFTQFSYLGQGDIKWSEHFVNIYADALKNFNSSGAAKITLDASAPKDGEKVISRDIVISGRVESVELLADKVKVSVRSVYGENKVGEWQHFEGITEKVTGKFAVPISLGSGENQIIFTLSGTLNDGREEEISHNLMVEPYYVTLLESPAKMIVTMTYDQVNAPQGQTLQMQVVEPSGETCWYDNMETRDGGIGRILGETHYSYTLPLTAVVRYDGPYRIRAQYLIDAGDYDSDGKFYNFTPPTNYTVTVKTDEGTRHERVRTFTGCLAVEGFWNGNPGHVGPDWDEVADIVLVEY